MRDQKSITPLLQSLTRPILLLGAERENIILLACVCMSLCIAGRDFLSVALALIVWGIGVMLSKLSAKSDPWATKVFLRSLEYQDFYPAREKINTPSCTIKRKRKI